MNGSGPYDSLDDIPPDVKRGLDKETERLIQGAALPEGATPRDRLKALADAAIEYDEAIRLRAQFGRRQATGADLDALYEAWAGLAYEARRYLEEGQ